MSNNREALLSSGKLVQSGGPRTQHILYNWSISLDKEKGRLLFKEIVLQMIRIKFQFPIVFEQYDPQALRTNYIT